MSIMAASGGLVSIHVLNRLGRFLEIKSQLLICRSRSRSLHSCHRNKNYISCNSIRQSIDINELFFKVRLKSISASLQPCLLNTVPCCHISYSNSQQRNHYSKFPSTPLSTRYVPSSFSPNRSFHHNAVFHCSSSYGNTRELSNDFSDPFKMVEKEMANLPHDIKAELITSEPLLQTMSHYYFDGKGKSFRPLVTLLMSKACNIHSDNSDSILWSQKIVAMVAEMIHTASLVHDDVIDCSDTRRGDFILSQASIALASIGNTRVICILSSILEDLVSGEFMQLGSKEDENERFAHYLQKTYKKTASLIANACKSVAILSNCNEDVAEAAFQYGRNLGIAFQLVDDLLDFISSESDMGKPTAADLKLGLATAPVLFAAQEHPQLHPLIMRRFSHAGDVEYARQLVAKSDGVEQTRILAAQHSKEAIRNMEEIAVSSPQKGLVQLARILLDRKK